MVLVDPDARSLERFFADVPLGKQVYDALVSLVDDLDQGLEGDDQAVTVRVTKSQVAFRRRTGFCWVWLPGRYLARPAADVVVSVALRRRDPSPRWKEVVQVGGTRWMHHLEVGSLDDLDDEVAAWVAEAHDLAT